MVIWESIVSVIAFVAYAGWLPPTALRERDYSCSEVRLFNPRHYPLLQVVVKRVVSQAQQEVARDLEKTSFTLHRLLAKKQLITIRRRIAPIQGILRGEG